MFPHGVYPEPPLVPMLIFCFLKGDFTFTDEQGDLFVNITFLAPNVNLHQSHLLRYICFLLRVGT